MDLTLEQIKQEFKRQVQLNKSIGYTEMIEIVNDCFGVKLVMNNSQTATSFTVEGVTSIPCSYKMLDGCQYRGLHPCKQPCEFNGGVTFQTTDNE